MDPLTLQAVQTVGFPVVIALIVIFFLFTIIKWMMSKADKQYDDHRSDIILLSEMSGKNLNKVTSLFEMQLQKRDLKDEANMEVQKGMLSKLSELSEGQAKMNEGQLKILQYIDNGKKNN